MRAQKTDPAPEPGSYGLVPARGRMGNARLRLLNRELAILIGLTVIGMICLSNSESGPAPRRMRIARGSGDPRGRTISSAFSPDGRTVATIDEDGRVALRRLTEGSSLPRFLGDRGFTLALAFSPDSRLLALGRF